MKGPHGSYSTYINHACRCARCREANRIYNVGARKRRHAALVRNPKLATHGSMSTYVNWLCRCDVCRTASREYQLDRRSM